MDSFVWNDNYVTGLSEVDEQHHRLVDLINKFGDLLASNTLSFDDIEAVFGELFSYAEYHFEEEEASMEQFGVDRRHIDHHRLEHQTFLRELSAMRTEVGPDTPAAAKSLLAFLIAWLAYHILCVDQNMAKQIRSIEAGRTPGDAYVDEERQRDSTREPLLVALNSLFEQVSVRNRALLELNETLETKVAERTRELSEANLRLAEIASTDALTGLPNRRHCMHQIEQLWRESEEKNHLWRVC